MSIPARHDVARRMDCRFLATLAAEHKIGEDEAFDLAPELAYRLAKRAYRLLSPSPSRRWRQCSMTSGP
jgi:glucuronate isomerase